MVFPLILNLYEQNNLNYNVFYFRFLQSATNEK